MQIEQFPYRCLLNQPAQRWRAETTGLVDQRPRWRRADDAFVLRYLLGLGIAAATTADAVDLPPGLNRNRDVDRRGLSIRKTPMGGSGAVRDHGTGAAGKLGRP